MLTLLLLAQAIVFGPNLFNPSSRSVDVALEVGPGPRKVDVFMLETPTMSLRQFTSNLGTAANAHAVNCDSLLPGALYYWATRVSDPAAPGGYTWSNMYAFQLPGPSGYRIGAWGDNQNGPNTFLQIRDRFVSEGCQILLGLGDYVQDDQDINWRVQFGDIIGPIARYLPLIGCRGNHDGESSLARARWLVPENPGGGQWARGEQWGASPMFPALIVVLNSNPITQELRVSMLPGGAQRVWLEQLVASQLWGQHPVRIVTFHHPVGSEQWDNGCWYPPRPELPMDPNWVWCMDFLTDHGCTIVMNGHAHAYQRGAWTTSTGAMPWVISGGGGGYLDQAFCRDMQQIIVNAGANMQQHHFLTLDVTTAGVHLRALTAANGAILDEAQFPTR